MLGRGVKIRKLLLNIKIGILIFVFQLPLCLLAQQHFVGSFDLVSEQTYKNGNVRHDTLNYSFEVDKTIMTIRARGNQPDMKMIFDFADSTIKTEFVMRGKPGGYTLPMNLEYWPGMNRSASKEHTDIDKSLESREIEGIDVYKVVASSNDYDAELWVTDKYNLSMLQVLSYQSVGKGKSKKELELFEKFKLYNLPLIMKLESKNGKADVMIRLINFSEVD